MLLKLFTALFVPAAFAIRYDANLVDFTSPEGEKMLQESLNEGHGKLFYKVIANYRSQEGPSFCALSTTALLLNVFDADPIFKTPWRFEEGQLAGCPSLNIVRNMGLTLAQWSCLAALHGLEVDTFHADKPENLAEFRATVRNLTSSPSHSKMLAVNFNRWVLGQNGGGHVSPIAAYHTASDKVLIADVNRSKYLPTWVYLPSLWNAMSSVDFVSSKSRGYSIFSLRKETRPLILTQLLTSAKTSSSLRKELVFWKSYVESAEENSDCLDCFVDKLLKVFGEKSFCCTELDMCALPRDSLIGLSEQDTSSHFCDQLNRTQTFYKLSPKTDPKRASLLSALFLGLPYNSTLTAYAVAQSDISSTDVRFREELSKFGQVMLPYF